jgi:hypothetical protein
MAKPAQPQVTVTVLGTNMEPYPSTSPPAQPKFVTQVKVVNSTPTTPGEPQPCVALEPGFSVNGSVVALEESTKVLWAGQEWNWDAHWTGQWSTNHTLRAQVNHDPVPTDSCHQSIELAADTTLYPVGPKPNPTPPIIDGTKVKAKKPPSAYHA